jgi:hypothetical protein
VLECHTLAVDSVTENGTASSLRVAADVRRRIFSKKTTCPPRYLGGYIESLKKRGSRALSLDSRELEANVISADHGWRMM